MRLIQVFRRVVKIVTLSIVAAAIGMLSIFGTAYGIIYSQFDGRAELPADCAIVFGAAVYGQSLPGPAITRRIAKAADLYHRGDVRTLVVSGGKGSGVRESEAEVMRRLAHSLGVGNSDIIMEDQSHSTWENIQFTRSLTRNCSSVVGISDQYHLARIELLSWRQGWSALDTVPADERPPAESEKKSVMREMLAYIYYVFYIDVLLPDLPTKMS